MRQRFFVCLVFLTGLGLMVGFDFAMRLLNVADDAAVCAGWFLITAIITVGPWCMSKLWSARRIHNLQVQLDQARQKEFADAIAKLAGTQPGQGI